jgi:hypothetical protein
LDPGVRAETLALEAFAALAASCNVRGLLEPEAS